MMITPTTILTSHRGYTDTLALIGEWWAGALGPDTLAHSAPYPLYVEPQELGGFTPETPPEWNPRDPEPALCEGERDADDRACCTGPDVKRVTYHPRVGGFGKPDYDDLPHIKEPYVALWCAECRALAEGFGALIEKVEDAA